MPIQHPNITTYDARREEEGGEELAQKLDEVWGDLMKS